MSRGETFRSKIINFDAALLLACGVRLLNSEKGA